MCAHCPKTRCDSKKTVAQVVERRGERGAVVVQVSPHEFMQAVMSSSNKHFTIEQQGDVLDFWAWFINTLHLHLATGKRNKTSIISKCFQVGVPTMYHYTTSLQLIVASL